MLNLRRLRWALLVAAGLTATAATSSAVDLRLLPPNTEIVFTVNIKQILDCDLVKGEKEAINQFKAAIKGRLPGGGDEAEKYLKQMGFDPFRDLVSITIAHTGSQDPRELFFIIEANVDPQKFAETAKTAADAHGDVLRVSKAGKATLFEITIPGDNSIYGGLLTDKSIVLTSSEESLKAAIARSSGRQIAAEKVRELLKATSDKQSLNFVVTGNALNKLADQVQRAKGGAQNPAVANAIANIEGISGALTITKEIDFMLGVGAKDEKTAKEMVFTGNLGLTILSGVVAAQAKNNADLTPLVDVVRSLRLSSVGSNALLKGNVSTENLEKLVQSLKNLQGN